MIENLLNDELENRFVEQANMINNYLESTKNYDHKTLNLAIKDLNILNKELRKRKLKNLLS